ncbi:hypothetical protein AB1Y20_021712 [Prymnesium parvum]|uniref:Uncharacterized protein n=1 Tax=Prymnesium parvum TaxID=97485 RepID=A0AB34JMZ9_PRYPA
MRIAFQQAQNEINTLGICLTFVEQSTCTDSSDMIIVAKFDVGVLTKQYRTVPPNHLRGTSSMSEYCRAGEVASSA